jgi:hypothetical protein
LLKIDPARAIQTRRDYFDFSVLIVSRQLHSFP